MQNIIDKNFIIRLFSSIVMILVFGGSIFLGGFIFSVSILLITFFSYFEWFNMVFQKFVNHNDSNENTCENESDIDLNKKEKIQQNNIYNKKNLFIKWGLIGALLILPFSASILYIRLEQKLSENHSSILYLSFFFSVIASTDIGAYLFGKKIGGPKIWPKISPNKTISGSICGTLLSGFVSILFKIFFHFNVDFLRIFLIGIVLSILSQIGGFIMSSFKRYFGVKDSSKFIPGHGGFLDRVDSFIVSMPFFMILILYGFFN
jgi:CDP-diglyceride synthetase